RSCASVFVCILLIRQPQMRNPTRFFPSCFPAARLQQRELFLGDADDVALPYSRIVASLPGRPRRSHQTEIVGAQNDLQRSFGGEVLQTYGQRAVTTTGVPAPTTTAALRSPVFNLVMLIRFRRLKVEPAAAAAAPATTAAEIVPANAAGADCTALPVSAVASVVADSVT